MRPPKIDFRFSFNTPKKYTFFNAYLLDKYPIFYLFFFPNQRTF